MATTTTTFLRFIHAPFEQHTCVCVYLGSASVLISINATTTIHCMASQQCSTNENKKHKIEFWFRVLRSKEIVNCVRWVVWLVYDVSNRGDTRLLFAYKVWTCQIRNRIFHRRHTERFSNSKMHTNTIDSVALSRCTEMYSCIRRAATATSSNHNFLLKIWTEPHTTNRDNLDREVSIAKISVFKLKCMAFRRPFSSSSCSCCCHLPSSSFVSMLFRVLHTKWNMNLLCCWFWYSIASARLNVWPQSTHTHTYP